MTFGPWYEIQITLGPKLPVTQPIAYLYEYDKCPCRYSSVPLQCNADCYTCVVSKHLDDITAASPEVVLSDLTRLLKSHRSTHTVFTDCVVLRLTCKVTYLCKIYEVPLQRELNNRLKSSISLPSLVSSVFFLVVKKTSS